MTSAGRGAKLRHEPLAYELGWSDYPSSVVPDETPADRNIEELAASLNDSLKTCRSMVSNYKALLETEQKDPQMSVEDDEAKPTDR